MIFNQLIDRYLGIQIQTGDSAGKVTFDGFIEGDIFTGF